MRETIVWAFTKKCTEQIQLIRPSPTLGSPNNFSHNWMERDWWINRRKAILDQAQAATRRQLRLYRWEAHIVWIGGWPRLNTLHLSWISKSYQRSAPSKFNLSTKFQTWLRTIRILLRQVRRQQKTWSGSYKTEATMAVTVILTILIRSIIPMFQEDSLAIHSIRQCPNS